MTQSEPNLRRVRRVLLGLAMVLAAILDVDRVCISQSQHLISAELGLSKKQMGLALSGTMNRWGCSGGLLAPWTIPHIREAAGGQWRVVILVIPGWYAVGALCWLGIDPVTPVATPEGTSKDEFPIPRIPAAET